MLAQRDKFKSHNWMTEHERLFDSLVQDFLGRLDNIIDAFVYRF